MGDGTSIWYGPVLFRITPTAMRGIARIVGEGEGKSVGECLRFARDVAKVRGVLTREMYLSWEEREGCFLLASAWGTLGIDRGFDGIVAVEKAGEVHPSPGRNTTGHRLPASSSGKAD